MNEPRRYIGLKIVLGAIIVLLIALGGFAWYVNQHYKTIIKTKLPGLVAKTTDGAYKISLQDISINILTRQVTIYNVKLQPDTNRVNQLQKSGKLYSSLFTVAIPKIQLNGIMWEDLLADKQAYCEQLDIIKPQIIINSTIKPTDSAARKAVDTAKTKNDDRTPLIEKYTVKKLQIMDADVTYHAVKPDDSFYYYARKGNIVLNNWQLDPGVKSDSSNFLYSDYGTISFDSIIYKKPKGLYNIKTGAVAYDSKAKHFTVKDLMIGINVSKEEFYRETGKQKEIYNLNFPSIAFNQFDWKALISGNRLFAQSVDIDNPSLDIFFSRLYPANNESKLGKYPHQLLHKLKLKMDIQKINLRNGGFKYTEVNEKTHKAGTLLFSGISGSLTNITNIDSLVQINKHCIIDMRGKFMRTSDMAARFDLLLTDTLGFFTLDGYLKDLNANQVNSAAEALAQAQLTSMHLVKMNMHVEGNQNYGKGRFTLLYNNLNVALKQADPDDHSLKDKPVISFVANKLLLYSDNPMQGDSVRHEDSYLKRDIHKSFFSLIWKNILQGAEKTALRNQKILEATQKDANGKKKGFFKALFGKKKEK